jgi:hypothetical protein
MANATRLRYEVWASLTGSALNWSRVEKGWYVGEPEHNELNKQRALERANELSATYGKVCVEEWDADRNVFLRTVREYPNI